MALQLSDFTFELPEELIAHYPARVRSASRLLCLDASTGEIQHRGFADIVELLNPEDLLVFNDTRVIPARLFGVKDSGGRVEVLIERLLEGNQVLAQIRASKSPKPGTRLFFAASEESVSVVNECEAEVLGREEDFFLLQFPHDQDISTVLNRVGHMPLPPYIRRSDELADSERYQTVYARKPGAVAAPTAGLHFDQALLEKIEARGIDKAFITLHVGAGTFQPVRVENVEKHRMHKELVEVSASVCESIAACKARGGQVIAVGTTTVRSLESAARSGTIEPYCEETDIFIYPGYEFKVVDAMITNFHLPESTLLMLVSAFCSKKMLLDAYSEAIKKKYRFFSYGDAMFVFNGQN